LFLDGKSVCNEWNLPKTVQESAKNIIFGILGQIFGILGRVFGIWKMLKMAGKLVNRAFVRGIGEVPKILFLAWLRYFWQNFWQYAYARWK